jgi:hypothetical protein
MGDEIAERTEKAKTSAVNFVRSYEAVIKGGQPTGGEGAAEGGAKAQSVLSEVDKAGRVPVQVFIEKAKEHDLYSEAIQQAKPVIREAAIKAYWSDHGFEARIYGDSGSNYRLFVRVLDAKLSNI